MPQKKPHASSVRKLSAIMFTDIEGYTALMQGNEAKAIQLRNKHREIFNSSTEKHGGKILQYYGDGTLSVFDSVIAAVECGVEMQLAFLKCTSLIEGKKGIPVRVGIHSGDVVYSNEEIIGDPVNIASRIESLATPGSVFISDKVFYEVKNKNSIEAQSMGWFELKNVEKSIEVFAISNEGLVVPDPDNIQGKAKRVKQKDSFFQTLWDRGQLQFITGYFAGIWGLVGFTDWITNRYQISPHWTDLLLAFFLAMIPTLLVYVWNIERVKQGKLSLFEKLFLPGNLVASLILLSFLFKGTDLGATTKTVHFNNENGVQQSKAIIKPGFREKLAIHNFLPEKEDSTHHWMKKGIHTAIAEDIIQNEYLTIGFWDNNQSLQEMISEAKGSFYNYSLTGTYSVDQGIYKLTSKLYDTHNGSLKQKHTYVGRNFFALIDTICLVTKKDLGITPSQMDQFVDLPFREAYTSNLEAYQKFSRFLQTNQIKYLEEAIALDSTFALANYVMASYQFGWSSSLLGAKEAINQGMRHRKRLPDAWKTRMKTLYFQINNQPDKAITLLKMQLEVNPGNQKIINELTDYLFLTTQYEELLRWRKKLATLDTSPGNQIDVVEALLLNAKFDEALKLLKKTLNQHPNQPALLGSLSSLYAMTGQIEIADSLLQKIIVLDPEFEELSTTYSEAFKYAKNHPKTSESLTKYKGHYRLQRSAAEYDVSIIKNLLFGKGREHMGGFFFIPSGPEEFLMGGRDGYEKWKFFSDTTNRVYKIKTYRAERNQQFFNNVLWRQDSLIREAMGLFSLEKNTEALAAFKKAYDKNPHHFYLAEYIKHLEFILSPQYKNELKKMKKYVGNYGPREIWMENEKFYYKRDGLVATQQLLPISSDLFYFYGGFEYYMQVVVEDGEVKGTISWEYNDTTGTFVRDDSDYIAYDKLKN